MITTNMQVLTRVSCNFQNVAITVALTIMLNLKRSVNKQYTAATIVSTTVQYNI